MFYHQCQAILKKNIPILDIHIVPITTHQFIFEIGELRLRGDVIVRCYQLSPNLGTREVMFSIQFHTCAITDSHIVFNRNELDYACDGEFLNILIIRNGI